MDYEKAYKDLMRDIDIAIEGQNDGETKVVLQNIKERNIESYDERIRKEIIEFLTDGIWSVKEIGKVRETQKYAKWIAYLERQKEQKPTEFPKSEDYGIDGLYAAVDILQKTLGDVDGYQTDDGILEHKCAISAVKELYEQKPAEWSEEDRKMLDAIIKRYSFPIETDFSVFVGEDNLKDMREELGWLKSLRPQPHWKPSEEQMEQLRSAAVLPEFGPMVTTKKQFPDLESLYNDLKSL